MTNKDLKGRREFLMEMAGAAGVGALSGCMTAEGHLAVATGAPMQDFACAPMKRLRVGVVGVGGRGKNAVERLSVVPGVEVTALCDIRPERLTMMEGFFRTNGRPVPKGFTGAEGWKALCAWDGIDIVYNTTHWELHAPIGVRALEEGKHAFIEVPAAMTVDECWQLVEASERARRHCMMLENCCYGEEEMLALNMCRLGIFGTLVHGEGAYIHEMRRTLYGERWNNWRGRWDTDHVGNQYPTHGLGPICQCFDINRGDVFERLVSLESAPFAIADYNPRHYPADDWRHGVKPAMGDMNTTLIRTAKGRSIMVQHDVVNPQPYTRIHKIVGTKGQFWGMPWRSNCSTLKICLAKETDDYHGYLSEDETAKLRELYRHPLWKKAGEIARKVGGHGGMDYIMDLRWAYCLRNGLPLDMDVYDLASWSSLCGLTAESVRRGSSSVAVPDFTRGAWRTAQPRPLADFDLEKLS